MRHAEEDECLGPPITDTQQHPTTGRCIPCMLLSLPCPYIHTIQTETRTSLGPSHIFNWDLPPFGRNVDLRADKLKERASWSDNAAATTTTRRRNILETRFVRNSEILRNLPWPAWLNQACQAGLGQNLVKEDPTKIFEGKTQRWNTLLLNIVFI